MLPEKNVFKNSPDYVVETDPDDIPAHDPGAKLDAGKPIAGALMDVSRALSAVVRVFSFGAKKYSRGGWQHVENGVQRYTDALWRHLLAEGMGEIVDPDSKLLHASQVAWNALARLELMIREAEEKVDRST